MPTRSLPLFLLVFALAACTPASRPAKSQVLGKWKEIATLVDGMPIGPPPDAPQDRPVIEGETLIEISLSGKRLKMQKEMVMRFPGQAPQTMSSDTLELDLAKPGKRQLMPDGPEYTTTAALKERALVVTYGGPEAGKVVLQEQWILNEAGTELVHTRGSPGTRSCTVAVQWDPAKSMPNPGEVAKTELAKGSVCRPSGGVTRVFKRQ